jgi:hypothetical protein
MTVTLSDALQTYDNSLWWLCGEISWRWRDGVLRIARRRRERWESIRPAFRSRPTLRVPDRQRASRRRGPCSYHLPCWRGRTRLFLIPAHWRCRLRISRESGRKEPSDRFCFLRAVRVGWVISAAPIVGGSRRLPAAYKQVLGIVRALLSDKVVDRIAPNSSLI